MLDRAAHLRTDDDTLSALRAHQDAVVIPLWRHRNLVKDNRLVRVAGSQETIEAAEWAFLGMQDERPHFAVALPSSDAGAEPYAQHGDFNDLRMAGPFMDRQDAELAAYARGLMYWHRHHRFCGKCGARTDIREAGHMRHCRGCDKKHFPRTDPAVMALITDGDRCVLARQARFPPSMFSILAGFVEPGESLEHAVVREVREEVGLEVHDVRYVRSQPWPFPASLMLGFVMSASTHDISLDDQELEEARWFSRAEIERGDGLFVPPSFSLAGQLIALWLDDDV